MNLLTTAIRAFFVTSLICVSLGLAMAQNEKKPAAAPSPVPTPPAAEPAKPPKANPTDVGSVDAIIGAVYNVISGPAGQKRDWDRMRSLFVPEARLIPIGPRKGGGYEQRALTVEDYITKGGPYLEKEGFFEIEIARKTDAFANIAQVFSVYESRHKPDEKPFARGINSIQLMNDGRRWWVVTILWQGEDEQNPLPEEYLNQDENK